MYLYIHVTTINEENAMNLSESKEICTDVRESLGAERKVEMIQFCHNLKN